MVELKNGDTYSGLLVATDKFQNMHLRDAIFTDRDGEKFQKIANCFIRGNAVKYVRLPSNVVDLAKQNEMKKTAGGKGRSRKGKGKGEAAGPLMGQRPTKIQRIK